MISKATYRQWLSCLMALTVSFIYGCKVGWTCATVTLFLSEETPIEATPNDISWMVSVSYTGTIFSVLLCYNLSDKFSRKQFVLGCTIFYVFAWICILFTSSMAVIIVCFFLYGIACSMLYIVCNIYIGEIANPKNRELIGASYNFATAIGIQVEFMMSAFNNYRWLALFPALVSVFALLISSLMIESPYYLVSKGKDEQALKCLSYLNDKEESSDSAGDLEMARKYVNEQRRRPGAADNVRTMATPGNLKLILVLVVVNGVSITNCMCVVSGTGSLMLRYFEGSVNGNLFVNVYSALRIVSMGCSFVTINRFKRRSLFLLGYTATGFIQLVCAICYYVEQRNANSVVWLANAIACLLLLFLLIYQLTFAVALEILKLEIFPHKFKEFYTSILCFTSDCFAFAVIKSYFYVEPILGNAFLMLVYAIVSFIGASVIFFCVPDTKGFTVSFIYGCKVGWTSATTTLFLSERSPFPVTRDDVSWMVSVSYTGTIFSVLLCYNLSDRVGRKQLILGCTSFYAVAWSLILFTSSIRVIVVCFFLYGIACSMLIIVFMIYVGEIASPKNREIIGATYSLATAVGLEVEFLMSFFDNYRWLALFPLLVTVFALVVSYWMVESPYYLASRARDEDALRVLNYLNDKTDDESTSDLDQIKEYINEQGNDKGLKNNFRTMLAPGNLKLILILIAVNGIAIMNCSSIITQTGSLMLDSFADTVDGHLFVTTYSTLRIVLLLASYVTIRIFDRRSLFLFGYISTGLLQLIGALAYFIESQNDNSIGWLAFIIAISLILFHVLDMLTFQVALAVLKMEIFPHKLKEFYTSVLAFTSDCFAFAMIRSYFYLEPRLGNSFLMFVYSIFSFVAASVIYIFVKDTKSKTLLQIRTDMKKESSSSTMRT